VPIDLRMVQPQPDLFSARKIDPARQQMWLKAVGTLGRDPKLHQCVVAYASDFRLLSTGLLPHGLPFSHPRIRIMASLDHSMWFHEPFRADEWLLYDLDSPKFHHSRALSHGRIYTQDGRLVVSVAQEGLIRIAPPRTPAARL
jgi:acyl-CoA thioesterase II